MTNNTKENECFAPSLYDLEIDSKNRPVLERNKDGEISKRNKNDFIIKIFSCLSQIEYSVLNDRFKKDEKKRRNTIIAIIISAFCVLSSLTIFAFVGWRKSIKNLAYSYFIQGNNLYENGNSRYALAYYKKSLQMDNNQL